LTGCPTVSVPVGHVAVVVGASASTLTVTGSVAADSLPAWSVAVPDTS
jgi:hypothetical protein